MIKNIVFDMGNVVLSYNPQYIIEHFTQDKSIQEKLIHTIFQSLEWLMLDKGTITKKEACEIMKNRVENSLHPLVEQVMNEWYLHMPQFKEVIQLSKELKEKGYNLYLLSNTSLSFYEYYQNVEAFHYFNDVYVSAEHLLIKPDVAIFKDFCNTFNLNPTECLFIDDRQENINSALSIGMKGVCFDGNKDSVQIIKDAIK